MTYARREEIFSKEAISTVELAELLGVSKSAASEKMQEIKRNGDMLRIKGYIHINDYIRFFKGEESPRYTKSVCEV